MLFFFNDTATTEIYTLSLHDALPISRTAVGTSPACSCNRVVTCDRKVRSSQSCTAPPTTCRPSGIRPSAEDRKSTRLNSSHANISYAVFCLKKKKTYITSLDLSTAHH